MSSLRFKMWLDEPVRGFMLDITGVLYESGGVAIDGSISALLRLKSHGFKVVLVSNESTQPTADLVEKLHRLGYDWISINDVITPVPAAVEVMREKKLNPHLLVHPLVESEFSSVVSNSSPKSCVIVGDADQSFSFENMNDAFNELIAMEEPKLYCLGRGRYYRHNNRLQLDVGAFTAALEFATGLQAEVIGKPGKIYYQKALDHLQLGASEVLMVGDDLFGDVIGGREAGCRSVLVKTGKFRPEWASHDAPSMVADNLAHAVDTVIAAKEKWHK